MAQAVGAAPAVRWAGGAGREPGPGGGPRNTFRGWPRSRCWSAGLVGWCRWRCGWTGPGPLGADRTPILSAGRVWLGPAKRPAPDPSLANVAQTYPQTSIAGVVAAAGLAIVRSHEPHRAPDRTGDHLRHRRGRRGHGRGPPGLPGPGRPRRFGRGDRRLPARTERTLYTRWRAISFWSGSATRTIRPRISRLRASAARAAARVRPRRAPRPEARRQPGWNPEARL